MKVIKNIFFYLLGAGLMLFGTRSAVKSISTEQHTVPENTQTEESSPFETIRAGNKGNAATQPATTNQTAIEPATPETATATQ
ncbi:hypothetical protein FACS189429_8030 [Bacteroidia bacterium]|nr:hypothetical protein FACS189429_8030 [Bacteroidia bacterium]